MYRPSGESHAAFAAAARYRSAFFARGIT
jgi:hypothetical protein